MEQQIEQQAAMEPKKSNKRFWWLIIIAVIVVGGVIWFVGWQKIQEVLVPAVMQPIQPSAPIAQPPVPDDITGMIEQELSVIDINGIEKELQATEADLNSL